jgi:hypothetical protein
MEKTESEMNAAQRVQQASAEVTAAEQTVGEIQQRQAKVEAALADLRDRKRTIALAAVTGDAAAQKQLTGLNADLTANLLEAETLAFALAEANAKLQAARETLKQAQTEETRDRVRTASATVLERARAVDTFAVQFVEALNAYRESALALDRLAQPLFGMRFRRTLDRALPLRLLRHLGARDTIELEHVSSTHCALLVDQIGPLLERVEEQPCRTPATVIEAFVEGIQERLQELEQEVAS